jgi:hypothetical protein
LADVNTKRDAIARELRRYCALHPRAADTLDGVRGWLPAEHRSVSADDLHGVLSSLVADGTLTRRTLLDGTVVYFSVPRGEGSA